ncbi:MAG: hypothetical protein RL213_858 [Bacteroidota bacterium]
MTNSYVTNAGNTAAERILVRKDGSILLAEKIRLLIVDDHRMFAEGLQRLLKEHLGVESDAICRSGSEAIDACASGVFDIVFLDIHMPGMSGLEAAAEIRRLQPDVKVIILSMQGDAVTVNSSMRAGADAYLLKDDGAVEIEKAVRAVIAGELYISSCLAGSLTTDTGGRIISIRDSNRFSPDLITTAEQAVLQLMSQGRTNGEIAAELRISERMIAAHRSNLLAKLQLPDVAALVRYFRENEIHYFKPARKSPDIT